MIYVDPAHPAFERLPRQHQAQIYHRMGWDRVSIAEEFGVTRKTVNLWLNPSAQQKMRERKKRYQVTPEVKAKDRARYHRNKARRQAQRGEGE